MRPFIETRELSIATPGGRPLFEGLTLRLEREKVALIGRNGVGKSTLLEALAEADDERISVSSRPFFVPQVLPAAPLSHGERRVRALREAKASRADVLLLDEPTEDLDDAAVAWLRAWLSAWPGCALVSTHDRRLLADFEHFFVASESGCRYFNGALADLDVELERDHRAHERRYASNLQRLAAVEERTLRDAQRKARKKRAGRCSEIDRGTPTIRLNRKRGEAQVSHGRFAKLRAARLTAVRDWTRETRRALKVDLSVDLTLPPLADPSGDVVALRGVSVSSGERELFRLDLTVCRDRVGVVGPNGAGKTTLLDVVLGRRRPSSGQATRDASRIGAIEQGGANWTLEASLASHLEALGRATTDAAKILVAHRFPLALAERPMRSLSPGERARAALICLFERSRAPGIEVLILDEPTYSLDLVGQRAMTEALRAWRGGLVVASHDRTFLDAVGVDRVIELGGSEPSRGAMRPTYPSSYQPRC